MALKTFNVDDAVYRKFSAACRENGMSMSKQIEFFMRSMVGEERVKASYIRKLEKLRKGPFVRIDNFSEFYGLK
jgi:antitoxin component of RelBE/YafQ-DinJ toxin-antitoxin module